MNQTLIEGIERELLRDLNNEQLLKLDKVLSKYLYDIDDYNAQEYSNNEYLKFFLSAKKVEGCSNRTIKYYKYILENFILKIQTSIVKVSTNDLRIFLDNLQDYNKISKRSLDNVRRVLSSFFNWLEEENYILKNPMKRIHKIKTEKFVKETYSDEILVSLKDNVKNIRDLCIIDILATTGMRVGELVKLNIENVDFNNRECKVYGKGNKERKVYFDAETKLHLIEYLNSRKDSNEALFVTLDRPFDRLQISGVEILLRKLGKRLGYSKIHPHKFRRTLATKAIDKGMPIEQVQKMLGHSKIDTTLEYAMVDSNNVKLSHKKFLS